MHAVAAGRTNMGQVRIREVVGTVRVVDGDSLLSPQVMERIVTAVMQAMHGTQRDDEARRRDTRIGAACCNGGDDQAGKP